MSEALQKFNQWKAVREKQSGKEVKRLHTDGGSEFTLKKFAEYLQSEGILVETTVLYISQSNGEVE
jgi:uroporphyrinogen-III synthase